MTNRLLRLRHRLAFAWVVTCLSAWQSSEAAVNSYRFMHVTIDTPWHIFFFLMIGVFAPFILMVVLMWRHSLQKRKTAPKPSQSDVETTRP